ncbi:hypothetical protein JVX91_28860 [Pseudomonas sp. PDNC002]|uniref:hypothetical protein n=1 Tax=Pseudomonas sp. PDNC002 TaxID=2811422 RepID=UPI001963341D|nr:hypothetical protein [Pseudomonas sp. PDNC002]QRY79523.1 hypothetical protein JVX91_28860 [Pseudomonas sp. PDNC002]
MQVGRRSKGSAKTYFESLGEARRCRLLEHATDWVSEGRPTREDRAQDVATSSEEVVAYQEIATADVETPEPVLSKKRAKKILFSLMLPPDDLDELRGLSERTGEAVAYHVREAIRRYLKDEGGAV